MFNNDGEEKKDSNIQQQTDVVEVVKPDSESGQSQVEIVLPKSGNGSNSAEVTPITVSKENETVTYSLNVNNDALTVNTTHTSSKENDSTSLNVSTNVKGVQLSANVSENTVKPTDNNDGGNETGGKNFSYQISSSYDKTIIATEATEVSTGANVVYGSSGVDVSLTVGVKRNYINPDNPMDVHNDERLRQEELKRTGERFNLSQKVGYSEEKDGLYSESSLMYRFNNQTFFNTTYNHSANSREVSASADLASYRVEYRNTENRDLETTTRSNIVNFMKKGGKFHYNANFAFNDFYQPVEQGGERHDFAFGGGMTYNRDQWGAFQDGFNAEVATSLSLSNGNVSGYKLSADLAYNIYGENERGNDFLADVKFDMQKQGNMESMQAGLGGALRFNGCRTIVEPRLSYFSQDDDVAETDKVIVSLGAYQQLGKDFGATTVFAGVEAGKYWQNKGGIFDEGYEASVWFGGTHQVSQKLSLNTEFNYNTGSKWSGNVGVRYSF